MLINYITDVATLIHTLQLQIDDSILIDLWVF